jgi:hypothetical protein
VRTTVPVTLIVVSHSLSLFISQLEAEFVEAVSEDRTLDKNFKKVWPAKPRGGWAHQNLTVGPYPCL